MPGGNPNELATGAGWRDLPAPPNAPAGGGGPGASRDAWPLGTTVPTGDPGMAPGPSHPLSPAARLQDSTEQEAAGDVEIEFGREARPAAVSEYTLGVLEDILRAAGLGSARITSTSRTSADQARAMYDNLETQGVDKQKRLYGRAGDKVIDVYVQAKAAKKSKDEILAAMDAKIRELGPSRVSKHCRSGALLQVVDVAPSSIKSRPRFVKAVQAERRVSRFLRPPADPAYHLEIPQQEPRAVRDMTPPPPPPAPPPAPKKKEKTWIEFKVVEDGTNRPATGVRLRVADPEGNENYYTTDAKGLVRIEKIDSGTCDIVGMTDSEAYEVIGIT